ncbi:MAG: hypothetical protein HZA49_08560 [Planctomycetes bacterium]|nr:hypothetical protein [Planctomycetota bacterium]
MYFTKPVLAVIKRVIKDLKTRTELDNLFESYGFDPKKDCDVGNKLNLAGSYLDHQDWSDGTTAHNLLELLTEVLLGEKESDTYRWPQVELMLNALIKDSYYWINKNKKFIRQGEPFPQPALNKPVEQKPSAEKTPAILPENTGEIAGKYVKEILDRERNNLLFISKFLVDIKPFWNDWQSFKVKLLTVLNNEKKRIIINGQVILEVSPIDSKEKPILLEIDNFFQGITFRYPFAELEGFLKNLMTGKVVAQGEEYHFVNTSLGPYGPVWVNYAYDYPAPVSMIESLSGKTAFAIDYNGDKLSNILDNTKIKWQDFYRTCRGKGYNDPSYLFRLFFGLRDAYVTNDYQTQIWIYAPIDVYIKEFKPLKNKLSAVIWAGPLIKPDNVALRFVPSRESLPEQRPEFKLSDFSPQGNCLYQKDIPADFDQTAFIDLTYKEKLFSKELEMPTSSEDKPITLSMAKKSKIGAKNTTIIHMPKGTKPNDITFRFKDRRTMDVLLKDNTFKSNVSFDELGFQKQSTGKKKKSEPSMLWELLVTMSVNYSNPGWSFKDKSTKGRQQISLLRDKLKTLLNIEDDPIPLNSELRGYRPEIRLEPPPDERHHSYINPDEKESDLEDE